jgi:hypothetical protein
MPGLLTEMIVFGKIHVFLQRSYQAFLEPNELFPTLKGRFSGHIPLKN